MNKCKCLSMNIHFHYELNIEIYLAEFILYYFINIKNSWNIICFKKRKRQIEVQEGMIFTSSQYFLLFIPLSISSKK